MPLDQILVLGYGSELRGDDALGPRAAEAIASWALPGAQVCCLPQLAPELAEPISRARAVLFLDARFSPDPREPEAIELTPDNESLVTTHRSDPQALLALARGLYGRSPRAWLIRLPAESFEIGAPLSPLAEQSLARALPLARALLERVGACPAA
jgi:hydrogenase maturation protease